MIVESDYKSESGDRAHLGLWPEMPSELGICHSMVLVKFRRFASSRGPNADQMLGSLPTPDRGSARLLEHRVFVRIRHLADRETTSESDTLKSRPVPGCRRTPRSPLSTSSLSWFYDRGWGHRWNRLVRHLETQCLRSRRESPHRAREFVANPWSRFHVISPSFLRLKRIPGGRGE